jgi:hypothetical protein
MHCYHPEMGEAKPADTQIEASLGHYGNHYYIKTPLALKGRGISHLHTLTAEELTPAAQHKAGWHEYKVTLAAMGKLEAAYVVSMSCNL